MTIGDLVGHWPQDMSNFKQWVTSHIIDYLLGGFKTGYGSKRPLPLESKVEGITLYL